jgi:hypothetical protein
MASNLTDKTPDISLIEELCLLAIDDNGVISPVTSDAAFGMSIVGACLVELCLRGRLDAELREIVPGAPPRAVVWVIDRSPVGEPALDYVLSEIAAADVTPVVDWTYRLVSAAPNLLGMALQRLQARGIIALQEKLILWVLKSRRYPVIDGRELREAKLRIVDILIGNSVPTPHDSVLIGLAQTSGVLAQFFSEGELRRLRPKIDEVSSLDIVAKEVDWAIGDEIRRRAQALALAAGAYIG